MGKPQTEPKTMEPNTMKTILCAALIVMSSSAAAMAESSPANSTNQHARDSASFYDSVPSIGSMQAGGPDRTAAERHSSNRHDQRPTFR